MTVINDAASKTFAAETLVVTHEIFCRMPNFVIVCEHKGGKQHGLRT
jgi:hypothetical protein